MDPSLRLSTAEPDGVPVSERMWRVYTHYSLHGNCLDAEYLPSKQFVNVLRAAGVFERGRVLEAEAQVVFKAVCYTLPGQKMSFAGFLTALQRIAAKLYKGQEATVRTAFARLVKDDLLRCCLRREPVDLAVLLASRQVAALHRRFRPAFRRIFQYYATGTNPG